MKRFAFLLITAMLAVPAAAQNNPPAVDCAKARDPARCEARQQAQVACKEKRAAEKPQCIHDKLPPPDCSKAEDRQRCEARQQARTECQGKSGKDLRACLHAQGLH